MLTLHDDRPRRQSYVLIGGERWYIDDEHGTRLVEVYTPYGPQLRRVKRQEKGQR